MPYNWLYFDCSMQPNQTAFHSFYQDCYLFLVYTSSWILEEKCFLKKQGDNTNNAQHKTRKDSTFQSQDGHNAHSRSATAQRSTTAHHKLSAEDERWHVESLFVDNFQQINGFRFSGQTKQNKSSLISPKIFGREWKLHDNYSLVEVCTYLVQSFNSNAKKKIILSYKIFHRFCLAFYFLRWQIAWHLFGIELELKVCDAHSKITDIKRETLNCVSVLSMGRDLLNDVFLKLFW